MVQPGPGAVLLVGGRSRRMGTAKAGLDWHGSTLLGRSAGVLRRAVPGPVVVVAAAGQPLPGLPSGVEPIVDPVPDQGPLAGLATGLARLRGLGVPLGFVCSTDLPFLHPAFVVAVLAAVGPHDEVAVPVTDGRPQPLAAGYRTGTAATARRLLDAGERRAGALLAACRTHRLEPADLLADPGLARADPGLRSLLNVNRPEDYRAALAEPGPVVSVAGARVRVHTLRQAAESAGVPLSPGTWVLLNGLPAVADPDLPLVTGDRLSFGRPGHRAVSPGR